MSLLQPRKKLQCLGNNQKWSMCTQIPFNPFANFSREKGRYQHSEWQSCSCCIVHEQGLKSSLKIRDPPDDFQILRNVLPSEIASSEDMYLQLVWKHGQGEISKDSIFNVNPAPSGLWVKPFLFYRYNSGTNRIPSQLDSNLDSNRLDCPLMRPSHR
jgi:hypothetical protein